VQKGMLVSSAEQRRKAIPKPESYWTSAVQGPHHQFVTQKKEQKKEEKEAQHKQQKEGEDRPAGKRWSGSSQSHVCACLVLLSTR
jgi:hypothetical protein